jgi:hypothetical protein
MSIENGKLPVGKAQGYIKNWVGRQVISTDQLRAFTIRRTELEFLLMQMTITGSNAARFYLGDKSTDQGLPPVPCLIMAGVDGFVPNFELPEGYPEGNIPGQERYFTYFPDQSNGSNSRHRAADEPIQQEYVLDFAYPCPDTCQLNSILMNP